MVVVSLVESEFVSDVESDVSFSDVVSTSSMATYLLFWQPAHNSMTMLLKRTNKLGVLPAYNIFFQIIGERALKNNALITESASLS